MYPWGGYLRADLMVSMNYERTCTAGCQIWSDFKACLHKARDWAIQQMAKKAEEIRGKCRDWGEIDYYSCMT
jgi:hypothetical protein